jgi:ABC-2 type transport system permease protein
VRTFARAFVAECRGIFLDPGAALILVGALVLYAFFYPTPYLSQVLKDVPVVVVDQDRSDISRRLVRMIDAHELTRVSAEAASLADAERIVRSGQAGGIVVIPAEFERRIRRGEQAFVAAYADASYFLIYRQVLTEALEATGTLSAGIEIRRIVAAGTPIERAVKQREPLSLVTRPLFNPIEGYASYVVPAVLVLILQQTLLVGLGLVGGTRHERRRPSSRPRVVGAGDALEPTRRPRRPTSALLMTSLLSMTGRALPYLLLYLVHCLFYFGIVYRLFGFSQQADALTLLRFATPFLLSVIFLGLTLRALFRSREMAIQVLLFTSLPALFVAGFAWPVEALPRWIATFARVLPSSTAIGGFLRLTTMGASLPQVREEWLTLWALCGVYFVCAWIVEAALTRTAV